MSRTWRRNRCASCMLLHVENKGWRQAAQRAEAGMACRRDASGAAVHFSEESVRQDIDVHVAKDDVAVEIDGERKGVGLKALLYDVGCAHRLPQGALPSRLVGVGAVEGVLLRHVII